jgi:predicted metalloprotease with PDZ domain
MKRIIFDKVFRTVLLIVLSFQLGYIECKGQNVSPSMEFTISMPDPSNHLFHVDLICRDVKIDTIDFKMPRWMPGYYQIMNYSEQVKNFHASAMNGKAIAVTNPAKNTWRISAGKYSSFSISYDVYAARKFVANNYLDTTHAYIIPPATFMYIKGHLKSSVNVKIIPFRDWDDIATGLAGVPGKNNEFVASDYDILFDCPILIGKLEHLPSFKVGGKVHKFIAYNPGVFNRQLLIDGLERTVKSATDLMGDIPYDNYTFIGIGPGNGGIEHLNNTTISFTGNALDKPGAMNRMLKFIGHEYFHHYNVKRIRPYELGPFDYDRENRTNLLWVSEGLTVYYEYLIVKRAGLMSDDELMESLAGNINTVENDEGRHYQSLTQSSYETWDDGPFGNKPGSQDKSISYYEKGPVVGMILDFSIRNATENKKSLDDVMRFLYRNYYQKLHRGFTDAEFQQSCEETAGRSLSSEFEYVNSTKDIDYSTYLSYAGLKIAEGKDDNNGRKKFTITRLDNMSPLQLSIFESWTRN